MSTLQLPQMSRIEKAGLIFELGINPNGQPNAKCLVPTPKGKYSKFKTKWFFRFATEERRAERIEQEIKEVEEATARINSRKEAKKSATKEFINPYKVGDIFAYSWGYEQTNIDFYEVIEVKNHSIVWQEICKESVIGSQGFMSDKVMPCPGEFIGDQETKIIKISIYTNGQAVPYIPMKYGCATLTKATESHYRSWYA